MPTQAHNKVVVIPLGSDDSPKNEVCVRETVDQDCARTGPVFQVPLDFVYDCNSISTSNRSQYFEVLLGKNEQLELVKSNELSYTFGIFFGLDTSNSPLFELGYQVVTREFSGFTSQTTILQNDSQTIFGGSCRSAISIYQGFDTNWSAPNGATYRLRFSTDYERNFTGVNRIDKVAIPAIEFELLD